MEESHLIAKGKLYELWLFVPIHSQVLQLSSTMQCMLLIQVQLMTKCGSYGKTEWRLWLHNKLQRCMSKFVFPSDHLYSRCYCKNPKSPITKYKQREINTIDNFGTFCVYYWENTKKEWNNALKMKHTLHKLWVVWQIQNK